MWRYPFSNKPECYLRTVVTSLFMTAGFEINVQENMNYRHQILLAGAVCHACRSFVSRIAAGYSIDNPIRLKSLKFHQIMNAL
ncbi:MAG: hypothetical protein AAB286_00920, partial [Pseudomonadota bacterium]